MTIYLNNTEDLYQLTKDVREEANKQLEEIKVLMCNDYGKVFKFSAKSKNK